MVWFCRHIAYLIHFAQYSMTFAHVKIDMRKPAQQTRECYAYIWQNVLEPWTHRFLSKVPQSSVYVWRCQNCATPKKTLEWIHHTWVGRYPCSDLGRKHTDTCCNVSTPILFDKSTTSSWIACNYVHCRNRFNGDLSYPRDAHHCEGLWYGQPAWFKSALLEWWRVILGLIECIFNGLAHIHRRRDDSHSFLMRLLPNCKSNFFTNGA